MNLINTNCLLLLILLISSCKPASHEENFVKVNLNFKDSGISYKDFFETLKSAVLQFLPQVQLTVTALLLVNQSRS